MMIEILKPGKAMSACQRLAGLVTRHTDDKGNGIHKTAISQLEFSILVRRKLKRGNFTSVTDLKQQILSFISYFNQTMAKPFKWTYKGRPLVR